MATEPLRLRVVRVERELGEAFAGWVGCVQNVVGSRSYVFFPGSVTSYPFDESELSDTDEAPRFTWASV